MIGNDDGIDLSLSEQVLSHGHLPEDGQTVMSRFPQFCCWCFSPLWWSGTGNFSVQRVAHTLAVSRYFLV